MDQVWLPSRSQGLISFRPMASKSAVLRVASCPSWARAVAAIATSLGISLETVKTHVVNAKDKLGAGDRTQLAVMALLYGLIDPLG